MCCIGIEVSMHKDDAVAIGGNTELARKQSAFASGVSGFNELPWARAIPREKDRA